MDISCADDCRLPPEDASVNSDGLPVRGESKWGVATAPVTLRLLVGERANAPERLVCGILAATLWNVPPILISEKIKQFQKREAKYITPYNIIIHNWCRL